MVFALSHVTNNCSVHVYCTLHMFKRTVLGLLLLAIWHSVYMCFLSFDTNFRLRQALHTFMMNMVLCTMTWRVQTSSYFSFHLFNTAFRVCTLFRSVFTVLCLVCIHAVDTCIHVHIDMDGKGISYTLSKNVHLNYI